ncbi:penicillin acylase family protein [Zavarzinia sp. CC-PAN008]|uniref:penicillin acylase family protein n=1 Tax=Zavarzinia sp. CC-PAN008 TaxID=3243332 RepID=UPI003F745DCD
MRVLRRLFRGLGWLLLGLVALVLLGAGGLALWLMRSVAPWDGTAAIAGLQQPVQVVRDRHGVPHIKAADAADAVRALGYVHAQDRLVQMELNRRLGAGRLAELVGPSGLVPDRLMRTLGVYRLAEEEAAAASPDARALLDAYAQGVNAWIDQVRGSALTPWPPELSLLLASPEPWRPADTLVIGKLLGLLLGGNWYSELRRAQLLAALPADQVDLLLPPPDPADRPSIPAVDQALLDPESLARLAAAVPAWVDAQGASNAWAVAPDRSATGSAILANDPHLGLSAPDMWYLARIDAPGFTVAGATTAGIPFPLLGHNGRVAWGMTTTGADTADLFVERLDPADPGRYQVPGGGSAAFATRQETIKVRFGEAEVLTVLSSRHGPVLPQGVGPAFTRPPGTVVALAHTALQPGDTTVDGLLGMVRAADAKAFVAALAAMHAPVQNLTFADRDGTVGLAIAGRIPVRRSARSAVPAPGWTGEYDWIGFLPFAQMPRTVAPAGGAVWNANNRISSGTPFIGTDFDQPFRADRIQALLDQEPLSLDKAQAMQLDVQSGATALVLPRLLALAGPGTPDQAPILQGLAAWDHDLAPERWEPLVYHAWLHALEPRLLSDRLVGNERLLRGLKPQGLLRLLDRAPDWCDDRRTREVEDCPTQVRGALADALAALAATCGADHAAWRWDAAHVAVLSHPALGQVPWLRDLFNLEAPIGGGEDTLLRAAMDPGNPERPFAAVHGAGFRGVYDLGDLDRSRFMISAGQSGNPYSEAYGDLLPLWRDGAMVPLPPQPEGPLRGTLSLAPAPATP